MVDYVSTELVAYADDMFNELLLNVSTFDELLSLFDYDKDELFHFCYPSLKSPLMGEYPYVGELSGLYLAWEMRLTSYNVSEDFSLAHGYPDVAGSSIYCFIIRQVGNVRITEQNALDYIGVCYYAVTSRVSSDYPFAYIRLPLRDIPDGINSPFNGNLIDPIEGEDIYWLYNLGKRLLTTISSVVNDIFAFEIGGYNFFYLIAGGGFLVYIGWTVIKWVYPL